MDQHAQPGQPVPAESFPTDPAGLPEATRPALLELADGDDLHLQIGPVAKRLEDTMVRMLGITAPSPARP
jgi:alpha-D-ribose 1-methylphosphonate 5-triphosphate synthase subunit PhnH